MHAIQPPASALKQAVPPKVYIVSRIILQGSPFIKVSKVPLQGLDLVGINAAVGVHMDCHLVEIVGAPSLEGRQLPDVRKVNMEHIAIQGHFPYIGPHVGNARLGHAFPNQRLLLRRHHYMKMDIASAFLCHRSEPFPKNGQKTG